MESKYDIFLKSSCCKNILESKYRQMIFNIIEDDELYATESMKIEFFQYLELYNGESSIEDYCSGFFELPTDEPPSNKKYKLKGRVVDSNIYNKEIGRVTSKNGFRWAINKAISNSGAQYEGGLASISYYADEALIDTFISDFDADTDIDNHFLDFLNDTKISDYKIQPQLMWTFDGYYDDNVYSGYNISALPCILGLPGIDGTEGDYLSIERITFSLRLPSNIRVFKPTSFDAGLNTVWRCGGKTFPHKECRSTFGSIGFEEFIHEPIEFKFITSKLFQIRND